MKGRAFRFGLAVGVAVRGISGIQRPLRIGEAATMSKTLLEINTTDEHVTYGRCERPSKRPSSVGFAAADVACWRPRPPNQGQRRRPLPWEGTGQCRSFNAAVSTSSKRSARTGRSIPSCPPKRTNVFWPRHDRHEGWRRGSRPPLIRLKRQNFVPDHDARHIHRRRRGGRRRRRSAFLLKEHRDLIDVPLVVNLTVRRTTNNGQRLVPRWAPPRRPMSPSAGDTRPGGHGSLPGPDNAIYRIADGLGACGLPLPGRAHRDDPGGLHELAALESGPATVDMLAVAGASPDLAAAERLGATHPAQRGAAHHLRRHPDLRRSCGEGAAAARQSHHPVSHAARRRADNVQQRLVGYSPIRPSASPSMRRRS